MACSGLSELISQSDLLLGKLGHRGAKSGKDGLMISVLLIGISESRVHDIGFQ